MNFLLIFIIVAIIVGFALVGTLLLTRETNSTYSGNKSISSLFWIYIASIPVLTIIGLIYWIF